MTGVLSKEEQKRRFADCLTEAIWQIKRVENRAINVIQDELGYAFKPDSGSIIEHWRKGNLPPHRNDVEPLARHLVKRGKMDKRWLESFDLC